MIERTDNTWRITNQDQDWTAVHPAHHFGGPVELIVRGRTVMRDCITYIDDFTDRLVVPQTVRASRKGGAALFTSNGHFPFGYELELAQTHHYSGSHMRVTTDIKWPRGAQVKRHFGLGCLSLPGRDWKRVLAVPPAVHAGEGSTTEWIALPVPEGGPVMVAHWHRPPLALVFERHDGFRLEVGTGSDLWRWEHGMGAGPESGSWKVFRDPDEVRLVREVLMCCSPFEPEPRPYRFTWHMAWSAPAPATERPGGEPFVLRLSTRDKGLEPKQFQELRDADRDGRNLHLVLDTAAQDWQDSFRRSATQPDWIRGLRTPMPCWQSAAVIKRLRRVVRQLMQLQRTHSLEFRNVSPGICWDPGHLDRRRDDGLCHWGIGNLLEFSTWTRQQLGPDWRITSVPAAEWQDLPSVSELFAVNGFETTDDT